MRMAWLIGGFVGCLLAVAPGAAAAADTGVWLGITNNQSGLNGAVAGSGTLTAVDPASGEVTHQQGVERAGFAMAWHGPRAELYAVQGLGGGRQALVRVDPDDLEVSEQVGVLTDADDASVLHRISAMSVAPDGTLYGIGARVELVGGFKVPMGVLVAIDPDTAVATQVGDLGLPVYSRGGAIVDGAFQLLTNTSKTDKEFHLYAVDLQSGEAAHTGATGIVGKAAGVGVDGDGQLMAVLDGVPGGGRTLDGGVPARSHLYQLDPSDAGWSLIGDTGLDRISGFTWLGDASCVDQMPELGTPPAAQSHLLVHKNDTVTLTSGVYAFHKIDLKQGAEVIIDGDVEIHVTGHVQLNDAVMNLGGDPDALVLYVHGNKVHLKRGSVLSATVVAPHARVEVAGGSELIGTVWADSLSVDAGSAVDIDECLLGVL